MGVSDKSEARKTEIDLGSSNPQHFIDKLSQLNFLCLV